MPDLTGQRALITGAGGDIGASTALHLAAAGADLVLCDRAEASAALNATRKACAELTEVEITVAQFDVTNPDDIDRALDEMAAPASLLFNNAGIQGEFANILDADPVVTAAVLGVNIGGVVNVLQAFAKRLVAADQAGAVVNSASMAGVSGAPNMAAYSASKAAVVALTKSAAKDLAPHQIRVNAVSPAFIGPGQMWTKQIEAQAAIASPYFADDEAEVAEQMISMIPMRRYGDPREVADVVSFLLSPAASYLTGNNIEISGGSA